VASQAFISFNRKNCYNKIEVAQLAFNQRWREQRSWCEEDKSSALQRLRAAPGHGF